MASAPPQLTDACPDGAHVLVWDDTSGGSVCRECGLSSQAIVDWVGHDYRRPDRG